MRLGDGEPQWSTSVAIVCAQKRGKLGNIEAVGENVRA